MTARSQDLPELFCPTGAIWWGKTNVIREQRTFHIAGRTGWEISWQHGVDIDTPEDMEFTEALLNLTCKDD
jgi:N-acylneuraminate cytidylyltransferase